MISLLLRLSSDIGFLSMEGNHEWKPLLQEEYSESNPQISPDGRWIAYTSGESEQQEAEAIRFGLLTAGNYIILILMNSWLLHLRQIP